MKIQKNESGLDRTIRVVLAIVFFVLAYYYSTGALQILFYILSVVMLVTAVTGFCALYKILKINTNKNNTVS